MVALNDAQTAAMLAFLKTRRGDKALKPDELVESMLKYLKAKGIPVNELETLAPGASEEDKEDFIQQCTRGFGEEIEVLAKVGCG